MDNFLSNQKAGAADISAGSFSINRERALELAKTLQLPEKRAYILKLVQWAVTSNASFIEMNTSKGGLTFKHNGTPPNSVEMEKLKQGIVDFANLSSGVYGALGLEPSELLLCWGGKSFDFVTGDTADFEVEDGWIEIRIEGINKSIFERSTLVSSFLKKNWTRVSVNGALQRLLLDAAGLSNIEAALVRTFCGLCCVPFSVNKKFVNSVFEPVSGSFKTSWDGDTLDLVAKPSKLASAVFLNHCFADTPGELLAPLSIPDAGEIVSLRNQWFHIPTYEMVEPNKLSREEEFQTSVTLDGVPMYRAMGFHRPMNGLGAMNVILMKDGVAVDDYQEVGEGFSGIAYFSVGGLKTSADGLRPVRDEAFDDFRSKLRDFFLENQVDQKDYRVLLGLEPTETPE